MANRSDLATFATNYGARVTDHVVANGLALTLSRTLGGQPRTYRFLRATR